MHVFGSFCPLLPPSPTLAYTLTHSLTNTNTPPPPTHRYELLSKGKLPAELSTAVPDIYLRNEELDSQARVLREQVDQMRVVVRMPL